MKKTENRKFKFVTLLGTAALAGIFLAENSEQVFANTESVVATNPEKLDFLTNKLKEKEQINAQINKKTIQIEQSQAKLKEISSKVKDLKANTKKIAEKNQNLYSKLALLEKQESDLKVIVEAKNTDLSKVSQEMQLLKEKQVRLKTKIEQINKQAENNEAELAQKQKQVAILQTKLNKLGEQDLAADKAKLADLIKQKDKADDKISYYEDNKDYWQKMFTEYSAEEKTLSKRIDELEKIPEQQLDKSLKDEKEKATKRIAFVQSKVRTYSNLLKFRSQYADEARELLAKIMPQIESLQKEITGRDQVEQEKTAIQQEINQLLAEINNKNDFEQEKQKLNEQLKAIMQDLTQKSDLLNKISNEKDQKQVELATLEKQILVQTKTIDQNKVENVSTLNEITQLQQVNDQVKNELQTLTNDKAQLMQDLAALDRAIADYQNELKQEENKEQTGEKDKQDNSVEQGVQTEEVATETETTDEGIQAEPETKDEEIQTEDKIQTEDQATQVDDQYLVNFEPETQPETVPITAVVSPELDSNIENVIEKEQIDQQKPAKKKVKAKLKVKVHKGKWMIKNKKKWQAVTYKKLLSLLKKYDLRLSGKAKLISKNKKIDLYNKKFKKMHRQKKAGKTVRIYRMQKVGKKIFVQISTRGHWVLLTNLRFK